MYLRLKSKSMKIISYYITVIREMTSYLDEMRRNIILPLCKVDGLFNEVNIASGFDRNINHVIRYNGFMSNFVQS